MKRPALAIALTGACLLSLAAGASPVVELEPGGRYVFEPEDAECFAAHHVDPAPDPGDIGLCPIRAGALCRPGGEALLQVISCVTLRAAAGSAHAHYQLWFRVNAAEEGEAAAAEPPGFVPIHVFAPDLVWDLKLRNGALSEAAGVASARYALRLRADPSDDLGARGATVTEESVLLATHGGISGCLSIPTGWDDVANLAIDCTLATDQIQQGTSSPSLSAIVEVGRTYSLEIAMDLGVQKRITVKPTSLEVSGRNEQSDPEGPLASENTMKWSRLVLTVASDTSELERALEELRADFAQHGHRYRTGVGVGHNEIEVSTSLPSHATGEPIPDDGDRDGVADAADACPDSVAGTPVNAIGCSVEDFCALHDRPSACRAADWDAAGPSPKGCAWKRQQCRAAY